MKKLVIVFLLFLIPISVNATTVLYRLSSNEVEEITEIAPANVDTTYIGILTDPPLTDGTQWLSPAPDYQKRVLGYAKINDNGTIRNATQNEIDTFAAAAVDDRNKREADRVIDYFQNDYIFRRAMIALIKGIIKEDNENRLWIRDFKDVVAASTSLANLQSRVAALDTPVDREFQDAKDYIISQVSKDD